MIQAVGKYIIVKPVKKGEKKDLVIITSREEAPKSYIVQSKGELVPDSIEAGSEVFLYGYRVQEIEDEGDKVYLVEHEAVYGVRR